MLGSLVDGTAVQFWLFSLVLGVAVLAPYPVSNVTPLVGGGGVTLSCGLEYGPLVSGGWYPLPFMIEAGGVAEPVGKSGTVVGPPMYGVIGSVPWACCGNRHPLGIQHTITEANNMIDLFERILFFLIYESFHVKLKSCFA